MAARDDVGCLGGWRISVGRGTGGGVGADYDRYVSVISDGCGVGVDGCEAGGGLWWSAVDYGGD